jgi:hypothetical protein
MHRKGLQQKLVEMAKDQTANQVDGHGRSSDTYYGTVHLFTRNTEMKAVAFYCYSLI